jgi:hypothetical protein
VQQNQSNTTIYGVISDGYAYKFLTITQNEELKQSKIFDIIDGDKLTILGCLKYMLKMSADMSPNVTPKMDLDGPAGGGNHGDYDSALDIDDSDAPPG